MKEGSTPAKEEAAAMLDAYARAVADRDLDAFLRLYDPAVCVFDAWDTWIYEDREAWRRCVNAWFTSTAGVQVRFEDVRQEKSDDSSFAALTAIATYSALAPDGTTCKEMQNRITMVLRRSGDVWCIVHEHTSAPIDLGHSKPILRRVK